MASVSFGVEGIGLYTFPTSNVDPRDAAQIYLTNSVSQAMRQMNWMYLQVANPNGTQSQNGIFLSSVVTNNVSIYQQLLGGYFYYNNITIPYPASNFQNEHNEMYNSVLDHCSSNNITSNELWSVSISYFGVVDQNNTTGIIHEIKNIKTADVNVM